MKTTGIKSSAAVEPTKTSAPFFEPEVSRGVFFGIDAGRAAFFQISPNRIQMKPSECELPKMNSDQFARAIGKLVLNNQLTESEASDLLVEYSPHDVSRCVRARLIHKLKKTPASKPSVQSPVQVTAPANSTPGPGSPMSSSPGTIASTPTAQPVNNTAIDETIQSSLEHFLDQFSNISVEVSWVETTDQSCIKRSETVSVHPPYFIARAGTGRRKKAEKNRERASKEMRALIKEIKKSPEKGGMGLNRALGAKASPEDIQVILQRALHQNLIPAGEGKNHPDSQDMQDWMTKYGIGIDCSGFVSQALNQMMRDVVRGPLAKEQELDVIDIYSGNLEGGGSRFTKVKSPQQLRPGDTMHVDRSGDKIDHIRIITSVRTTSEGFIEFDTGESTGGGPRGATWRYEKPDTFRRNPLKTLKSDQTWGAGNKESESITFGRYKQLKALGY